MEKRFFCQHVFTVLAVLICLFFSDEHKIVNSQFISYINSKGLKGNITFNIKNTDEGVLNSPILVVEALIESDQLERIKKLPDESKVLNANDEVQFDWMLNNAILGQHGSSSGKSDDCQRDNGLISPQINENIGRNITAARRIVLGKLNRWTIPFKDLSESAGTVNNASRLLSSIIWGKSVRLILAPIYGLKQQVAVESAATAAVGGSSHQLASPHLQPASSPPSSFNKTSRVRGQNQGSGGPLLISRPHLNLLPASSTAAPRKPTFAPRPKPKLSKGDTKPKTASSLTSATTKPPEALPKPEALLAEEISESQSDDVIPVKLMHFTRSKSSTRPPDAIAPTIQIPTTTATPSKQLASSSSLDTVDETSATMRRNETLINREILRLFANTIVCANVVDTRQVKTVEATFESAQIGGRVTMRANEDDITVLMVNLYHIRSKVSTRHEWKIMASDILDNRRNDEKCKYLQVLFDPNNVQDSECKTGGDMSQCKMGDLSKKHGQIQVVGSGKSSGGSRITLIDTNLQLSALLESSRALFLVIYEVGTGQKSPLSTGGGGQADTKLPKTKILDCAQINPVRSRKLEAIFNMDGVRGSMQLAQRHPTEPTRITYDLFGLEGNIRLFSIRELPLGSRIGPDNNQLCSSLGDVFNPGKTASGGGGGGRMAQLGTTTTFDAYEVGDLSGKHGQMAITDSEYEDRYTGELLADPTIQLFGHQSVAGRSILIQKNNGVPWVCATLEHASDSSSSGGPEIIMAVATFNYPVVGMVKFQQLSEEPSAETGVLIEVYNPNSDPRAAANDEVAQMRHNWMVHLKPAMADFYNWSDRCQSSGDIYDPNQASLTLTTEAYSRQCQASLPNEPMRCRTGDTGLKSGFKLALPTASKNRQRLFYSDPYLPLSGLNSIIGRSVVIYDEQAPTQRGNRLACATIKRTHPIKAQASSWSSGPGIPSDVRGSVSFEQEAASKLTRIKLDLNGLNRNAENYAIHNVWVMADREFPCSNDSLYGIYDPFDIENSLKLPPSAHYGSLATVDRVKVGDLSRKHGNLESLQTIRRLHLDANAPLFAPKSIIGRSIVLRLSANDFGWVCGNIEPDFDRTKARQIVGVASFDEPVSKVAGYVRFIQLEHGDGSLSDTFIQIDLKLSSDGIHEPETSAGHNWSVFVNQVGADAFITADEVRCIASGFKWNPYLAQDNLDTYGDFCNPNEPLGCAMGDLGMRHNQLTLGPNNRLVLSDSNLPLVGNFSIMGRSLIIFDNKRPSVKLACANIYPEIHVKSNIVLKRTPSFTVAKFIEQMRALLGAADWLMVPELGATKSVADSECVQLTIHFYGQKAHQMQAELNNLISMGTVKKSSRIGTENISIHYRMC